MHPFVKNVSKEKASGDFYQDLVTKILLAYSICLMS